MDVNELYKDRKSSIFKKELKMRNVFVRECAQLNSTAYTFRGILNMFKQSFKVLNRRRLMKKLGSDMSFENYKKHFLKDTKPIKDFDKYVHPMVNEGNQINPFNIKSDITEKNEISVKDGMNDQELEDKKAQWLKPVKAGSIPSRYKYK